MRCSHNFVFTQGYFVCTKCGKRSYGKSYKKKQGKKVAAGIIIVLIVGVTIFGYSNGIFAINQNNLEKSLENMPKSIQDAGETAKDFATDTSKILRETIDQQLDNVQMEPIDVLVDEIKNIPQTIKEKNLTNQKPVIDKIKLEKKVHQLTNQYRTQHGLQTLAWDDKLSNVARSHS